VNNEMGYEKKKETINVIAKGEREREREREMRQER